jgi:xanthine dehydrogenase accessory factor
VIATMGENDEEALAAAIAARCPYIAVVASRKRFAEMHEALLERGIAREALEQVHNPAGLDIGARLPEEVALSILAEIVQHRSAQPRAAPVEAPASEKDPVCGMTVEVATARHRATHAGHEYFFCNPRCREKFLSDPARFLAA